MASQIQWPVNRVRQTFIDFFKEKGHTFWPSSPVVPLADPTLLFINAGMNQYKELFLGTADPNTEFGKLKRAANSQLCIRAGGKHNDLDDVGNDTYHHTFFEMLGCWSFGDYFKKEIIAWSWELLTNVYKLPADQLYVTYFEGNPELGLAPDEETRKLWAEIVPASQIIAGNAKDNFWEMGDTGPCGPCTEIHFDRIGGRNAADLVNKDDPMVIEIWNLVLIEFERRSATELVPLPQKHVDTGMGLERLTSILQGVTSNYDTDSWTPLFDSIQAVTGFPVPYESVKHETNNDVTVAYRVVADHIRCLTTALADGAVPDSVGRGFVLRRIIRRAIRYGVQFLNAKTGFFSELVDAVVKSLGDFYTHLREPRTIQRVKAILLEEEQSFAKTWVNGLKHFQKAVEESRARAAKDKKAAGGSISISGQDAFVLHDRYGFPVDLTYLLASKEGLQVDMEGFQETMKASQTSAGRVAAAKTYLDVHQIEALKSKGVPATNDTAKYKWTEITSEILAIWDKKAGKFIDLLPNDNNGGPEDYAIILRETNFYSEGGGQIYDTGLLVAMEDAVFEVAKVYNLGGYAVHIGNFLKGAAGCPIPSCADLQLQVNYSRRQRIASNHTATHQLNWVLRRVLQENKPDQFFEVHQKGSLVTEDLLRFDFSYPNKLTVEELKEVEETLNAKLSSDLEVYRQEVPLEVARRIRGCRQMFGEKYPDPVGVVSVGVPVEKLVEDPENPKWGEYAIEFCGGTHLEMLCEAQQAVILSEEALMKGVRRIVVVTGENAQKAIDEGKKIEDDVQALIDSPVTAASVKALSVLNKKINDSSVPLLYKALLRDRVDAAIKQGNAQLKVLAAEAKEKAAAAGKEYGDQNRAEGEVTLLSLALQEFGADREALQAFAEGFLSTSGPLSGIFLAGVDEEEQKGLAVVQLSPALVAEKKLSAVNWAKAAVGKGGGKPQAAQSGFSGAQLQDVMEKATSEALKMKK